MKRKFIPLALLPLMLLTACGEVNARPTDYEGKEGNLIVSTDGAELDLYNNLKKIIYDAKLESGSVSSLVLDEILYQISTNIYGTWEQISKYFDSTTKELKEDSEYNKFIDDHKVYWSVDNDNNRLTDETSVKNEKTRLTNTYKRICERINKAYYKEINGSYTRNNYFYEEDYLMSLRNSLHNVQDPSKVENLNNPKPFFPDFDEQKVFDPVEGYLHEGYYTDYTSKKIIPELYRELLVEQYLFDSNYAAIGRAYARNVNIVTIKNREKYPLLANDLMNAYIDNYINYDINEGDTNTFNTDFDIIRTAWIGHGVGNLPEGKASEYKTSTKLSEQAAFLLNASHAEYEDGLDDEGNPKKPNDFLTAPLTYWKGTSYGALAEKLEEVTLNPNKTNSTYENEFTNNGEYTVAQGLANKTVEVQQEDYITDGWHIRNGGLADVDETIRNRIFNIGVANALDNDKYDDRFVNGNTYAIPESENAYIAKIHGRYFLKPVTTERHDNVDFSKVENRLKDILWVDQASGSFTIVEIKEAVSSSKLALGSDKNYEHTANFDKMEETSHEVAYQIAQNDSYRTLSTKYWLKAVSDIALTFHDDTIMKFFKDNYPELFED